MPNLFSKPDEWVVGLTGGIGSGKTAVSDRLKKLGARVIDTDEIAHSLTQSGGRAIPPIREAFGELAIQQDGSMNRDHMRAIVFKNPESRVMLEKILHPKIREEVQRQLALGTETYFLVVVPLLFEKGGWDELMDEIVVVDCPVEQQVKRVIQRNGWPETQVRSVINNQTSREIRLQGANHVIENTGDLVALLRKTDSLHRKLIKKTRN